MALRGHASIQGSTDIPTLYNILPGYLPMPHADDVRRPRRATSRRTRAPTGWWGNVDAYFVSLLKAWCGRARDRGERLLLRLPAADRRRQLASTGRVQQMLDGQGEGLHRRRREPGRRHRERAGCTASALAKLDWLVVRDLVEIETASFWYDSPEIESGELRTEEIPTEVFFLPAAAHVEKDGSFTNTQRLLQWHFKAVEPKGDCRSELWFYYHLGRHDPREARRTRRSRARPAAAATLHVGLPDARARSRSRAPRRCSRRSTAADAERRGARRLQEAEGRRLDARAAAGSTAASTPDGDQPGGAARSRTGSRATSRRSGRGRGRRTGACSTTAPRPIPTGKPWSERKRYVWWDAERGEVDGRATCPTSTRTKPPDYVPPDGATGRGRDRAATTRSSCRPTAAAGSSSRRASRTGRCRRTTSRTSRRSTTRSTRSARTRAASRSTGPRTRTTRRRRAGRRASTRTSSTTYRLTEHHTAGGMSRFVPYLAELQPAMFCEVHPELAARARARARRLGDDRHRRARRSRRACSSPTAIQPLDGRGPRRAPGRPPVPLGHARADDRRRARTTCSHIALDPNVHIQEVEGVHVRHPARPAAARRRRCREFVERDACASRRR